MAEYVDLNKTEILNEAGEAARMVVEENGKLKRVPVTADALPTVLTPIRTILDKKANDANVVKAVNGVEPDENGNVTFDALPEGATAHQHLVTDETGAAKWEARTHYVAPDGTVHPLDAKYIPESIARTEDVNAAISALGSVLRFKGTVATVDLLPADGNVLGDVYYVTEGSSGYVWIQDADGTQRWEQLGPMISGEFLPTGATANQVLVTDGEGNVKWEDKAFGYVETENVLIDIANLRTAIDYQPNETHQGYVSSAGEYVPLEAGKKYRVRSTTKGVEGIVVANNVSNKYNSYIELDITEVLNLGCMVTIQSGSNTDGAYYIFAAISFSEATAIEIDLTVNEIVEVADPIDDTFLPSTVPVIQSAPTADDAGKFLRVQSDGTWGLEAIPNAEEASF